MLGKMTDQASYLSIQLLLLSKIYWGTDGFRSDTMISPTRMRLECSTQSKLVGQGPALTYGNIFEIRPAADVQIGDHPVP
jgi:hypothetical protein